MISFKGSFELDKPLASNHLQYLIVFSKTRRVSRDALMLSKVEDSIRESVGLPLGDDGCYYVGAISGGGSGSVVDYNQPPADQPSIWCRWVPDEDGDRIVWNESAQVECHFEWVQYLVTNFLKPWGYKLNGTVKWISNHGSPDAGKIVVKDNLVEVISLSVFA